MQAPKAFAAHINEKGYHPRSNKHSNELARLVVEDLVSTCPRIREHAAKGELVYSLNFRIRAGSTEWNVDLVLGEPTSETRPPAGQRIARARPSSIRIAIELKSVMTEHRKASRNRQRDLDAFHAHVHEYDNDAVAGALVLYNISPTFTSPLRNKETTCPKCKHTFVPLVITRHREPEKLVEYGVALYRGLPTRSTISHTGLEAASVVVVDVPNAPGTTASVFERPPAPQVGDPLHFDRFIQVICQRYTSRWK